MAHKHSFPIKGIEALIKLADKHNLQSLAVDGIVIVPRPKYPVIDPVNKDKLTFVDGPEGNPRKATPREREEINLFGLAGIMGELPDSLTEYGDDPAEKAEKEVSEH